MYVAMLRCWTAGERLNVLERDSVGELERISFAVKATRRKHEMLSELRANDAADQVMVFRDPEEE